MIEGQRSTRVNGKEGRPTTINCDPNAKVSQKSNYERQNKNNKSEVFGEQEVVGRLGPKRREMAETSGREKCSWLWRASSARPFKSSASNHCSLNVSL
jgi:hypothetical protein